MKESRLDLAKRLIKERGISEEGGYKLECGSYNDSFDKEFLKFGKNVKLHSGTVLANDGQGFVWNKNKWLKFPHYGKVIIEDDVEIGANVTIPRGNLHDTIIKRGTKIGNQANIGHNSIIGENCMIGVGVIIGGSCKIGNRCFIKMGAKIADHVNVPPNTIIGMGAVVLHDITEEGTYVGIPARKIR